MSIFSFLIMLFIASITGSIGASLVGRRNTGCLPSIALGFIGAVIGIYIAQQLNLPRFWTLTFGGHPFPIVWAVIGSALFVAVLNLFSKR
ncbi:MAG: hypothetical protein A2Y56_09115 [Candidatus Aminicenantes bacterium RBG_13_63_10]|nr:MAG: hypothetical protein A2Y56_09115 [Candidatus Aminicenantes bacterium RBG_13_63_10]